MANRRMFSLDVVDTDRFLDMSASAQALYFHLGMRADDDGFVSSPRKIARKLEKTPSEKDRLKAAELIGKRYGLFTDKIETDVDMDLNITIDYGDE